MAKISLRTIIGTVAVVALLFNTAYAYTVLSGKGGKGGWLGGTDGGGEGDLGDLTVKVPDARLYDLITYDSYIFAEMYYKNMSSGQWEDYQLKITGQLKRSYPGIVEARDGYWVPHQCVEYDTETTATFIISISSSDGTPLEIGGNLEVNRKEYIELNSRRPIDAYTQASVEIDRLPRYNVPLSFKGWIDAYPDPNKKLEDTVDGRLFGDGQTIKRGDNGTFTIQQFYEDFGFMMGTRYNWSAEAVQKIADVRALRVNITAALFGADTGGNNTTAEDWFNFNETVWISNDCPFPVKRYSLNDQAYEDTDRSGNVQVSRFVMEISNTMLQNGYSRGTGEIPWGSPEATEFNKQHPKGEFTGWQYSPTDGTGIQSSSFDLGIDEAVNEATANSSGLQDFIARYSRPGRTAYVDWASYNATLDPTDLNGKAGLFRWNLSFAVYPDRNEQLEARQTNKYDFRYGVTVVDNVTKEIDRLRTVYKHRVYIEHDWGQDRGSASFNRETLSSQGCTLSSSEEIMMLDDAVNSAVTSSRTGGIDWKQSTYSLGAAGMGSASPGLQMVQTLTGMTFPSVDYAWAVQTQTVYESGHTFGAAVDVESGQLVYVLDIQGTALLGIFG